MLAETIATVLARHDLAAVTDRILADQSGRGLCLVALAANAYAEQATAGGTPPAVAYRDKLTLVVAAISRVAATHWWADQHRYGEAGHTVIFIEPHAGIQCSYHMPHATPAQLALAIGRPCPVPAGRVWSRRPLKPYVDQLLRLYVATDADAMATFIASIPPVPPT